jgi:hypothetical protein
VVLIHRRPFSLLSFGALKGQQYFHELYAVKRLIYNIITNERIAQHRKITRFCILSSLNGMFCVASANTCSSLFENLTTMFDVKRVSAIVQRGESTKETSTQIRLHSFQGPPIVRMSCLRVRIQANVPSPSDAFPLRSF